MREEIRVEGLAEPISHFTDGTLDTLDPTCFAPLVDLTEVSFT